MTTQALPWPLVKPWKHPLRFLLNKLYLLVSIGVFAYIGTLIITALYYLLFEVYAPMTNWWHNTVPNSGLRHSIRDVAEGLLGGLLAQQIIWNAFKKRKQKKSVLDKTEIALHIPNLKSGKRLSPFELVAAVPLVLLYAVPGFLVAYEVVTVIRDHIHHATSVASGVVALAALAHPHAASLLTKTQHTFTDAWPTKLMGYSAALFFGRRPAKAVFDHIQLAFAERRVALGKGARWYQPPTFQARVNALKTKSIASVKANQSSWQTVVMSGGVLLGLGLAAYGWYILNYIAQ